MKLTKPPDKYNLQSIARYYTSFMIPDDFCLSNTSEEKFLTILTNIQSCKAVGVDRFSGRFLKDGANILVKPISALCNLSISQGVFPNACKVAKLKPIIKKEKETDHPTTGQSYCFHQFQMTKQTNTTKQMSFYWVKIYYYQSGF